MISILFLFAFSFFHGANADTGISNSSATTSTAPAVTTITTTGAAASATTSTTAATAATINNSTVTVAASNATTATMPVSNSGTMGQVVLLDAPFAAWSFDAGNAAPSHVNALDPVVATPSNTVTTLFPADGRSGRALSGCVAVPSLELAGPPADTLTIALWARITEIVGYDRLVSKANGDSDDNHDFMISTTDAGQLRFRLRTTNGGTTTLVGASSLPLNEWVHIAATYNGEQMQLWMNGVADANTAAKTGPVELRPENSLRIGCQPPNDAYPVNGLLDDVRLLFTYVSPAEIMSQNGVFSVLTGTLPPTPVPAPTNPPTDPPTDPPTPEPPTVRICVGGIVDCPCVGDRCAGELVCVSDVCRDLGAGGSTLPLGIGNGPSLDGPPLSAIIGGAVGGLVVIAVIAFFVTRQRGGGSSSTTRNSARNSAPSSSSVTDLERQRQLVANRSLPAPPPGAAAGGGGVPATYDTVPPNDYGSGRRSRSGSRGGSGSRRHSRRHSSKYPSSNEGTQFSPMGIRY